MVPTAIDLKDFFSNLVLKQKYVCRFRSTTIHYLRNKMSANRECTRNVDILYAGKIKDLFVFDVFTQKVIFTQDDVLLDERLLSKKLYAFGNVLLGVNEKGEISKIFNLKEMLQEWEETKSKLRKDYMGIEFEGFLSDITAVLESEEKTITYLKSKNMFGMYFHGLWGKNDVQNTPVKRKEKIAVFRNTEITEEIRTDNKIREFIISAQKSDDHPNKIISTVEEINHYKGRIIYNQKNELLEGFTEIENNSKKIIHSVVWVG